MNLSDYYEGLIPVLRKKDLYTYFPKVSSACGRTLTIEGKECINFASCDYLGLANDDRMKASAIEAIIKYGCNISGSLSLSGYTEYHEGFESKLTSMFKGYKALMFTTSFLGNAGAIPMIVDKNDVVIADKLSHSSVFHGIMMSEATVRIYKHNDMNNLEALLKSYANKNHKILIATDGVFSADGDIAKLDEIVYLAEKYGAEIYVDDAHGVGTIGTQGKGAVEAFGLLGRVDYILGTMSKAFGSTGGFLVMKDEYLYEKMRHLCPPYISSRSVSPGVAAASLKSLEINDEEGMLRREKLHKNFTELAALLRKNGYNIGATTTPIIPVIFKEMLITGSLSKGLMDRNIIVSHFPPPYVEKNKSRLRLGITVDHISKDFEALVNELNNLREKQLHEVV